MRRFFASLLTVLWLAAPSHAATVGPALPGLDAFDREMSELLDKFSVPGGGLAVARNGELKLVRGYGVADRATGEAVTPLTVFRLASLSKAPTAIAIMQLAEQGKLRLDDRIIPLLGDLGPRPHEIRDPRVNAITVRHLLEHAGGFDRTVSGDPVFLPRAGVAMARQGATAPPDCPMILRDTLEQKLDFEPGARYAYSNLGYCILGRIIERVSGLGYADYVARYVAAPADAPTLRIGRTFERFPHEAVFYDYPGAPLVDAMPGVARGAVAAPYGRFDMAGMDSYGGWTSTPVDYLKFLLAIDGRRGAALLSRETTREIAARPPYDEGKATYYGLGFHIRPTSNGGANVWHNGSLPGTVTFAVRYANGVAYTAMFNTRPRDRKLASELDRALIRAQNAVKNWPAGDLFARCTSSNCD